MFDLQNQIGIKSWSFKHLPDNRECADAILSCKSNVVDLSGSHLDYSKPETWADVIAAYREKNIAIPGVIAGMKPDEAWNRRAFEFAKQAGAGLVSITFAPEEWEVTVRILERLSEEYNIPTAIHNHGGYDWLGSATMLNYIFNRTSKRIGLCLDTAWCMHVERENPVMWMERFGKRMYGCHFKDFYWDRNGKHYDAVVGEGAMDLPGVLKAFKDLENVISAVLEYEGDNAVECTAKSIANIRELY
jgi:sugar phosphate isomerase/epimerase